MIENLFSSLPFFVCLIWLLFFMLEYKKHDSAKKFFTFFLLVCTILYFSHAVFFLQNVYFYSRVENIYTFCTLAVYPLYYLYICKLTSIEKFSLKNYWVILPALIISLLSVIFYRMMSYEERINFVEYYFFHTTESLAFSSFATKAQEIRIIATKLVFILQLIPVAYYGHKKLSCFNKEVANYYANTENRNLSLVHKFLFLFILYAFFSAIANMLGRHFFLREQWMVIIPAIIFGSMLYLVNYMAYTIRFSAADFSEEANINRLKETEAAPTDHENSLTLSTRLKRLMEEEKLFRQKDLHISDVAVYLGTNRTYVSNHINQDLGLSFSDYINSYRVKYAQRMMLDSESAFSMLEISDQSGFANEVSFYRNFKKITGTTPNRWLHEHTSEF